MLRTQHTSLKQHNQQKGTVNLNANVNAKAARNRDYYEKNKEARKEKRREYYLRNKAVINKKNQENYEANKELIKEQRRQYYNLNKLSIRERHKEYNLKHADQAKELQKRYRTVNRPKIKNMQKEYYLKNKEALREKRKSYYNNNKHALKESFKRYCLEKGPTIKHKQKIYRTYNKAIIKSLMAQYRINNRQAIKEMSRKYYFQNKDTMNEANRLYRLENKGPVKEREMRYRLENKDLINMRSRLYYLHHKDKIRKAWIQYYNDNKEAIRLKMKNNYLKHKEDRRIFFLTNKKPRRSKILVDPIRIQQFFGYATNKLFISSPDDWYRISRKQMLDIGGTPLYTAFGSLGNALDYMYPEVHWSTAKLSLSRKKSVQRWVRLMLQQLLPKDTIILEDYTHPDLLWESGGKMQLDIWVPQYQLALEYQGEHHYREVSVFGPPLSYINRDLKKSLKCQQNNITLVTIPYWWNRKKESLVDYLAHSLPSLPLNEGTLKNEA
uniref:Uncharacterized protein n=1 Tax=Arcella intermedia TaxID=1963864 RepID=A0A6B2L2T6_9EUKA